MTTLSFAPALAARLASEVSFPAVLTSPDGEGDWVSLRELIGGEAMRGQFARQSARADSPAEVQVTHVVGWLAAAVIAPMVAARRTAGVVPLLDPDDTFVRCDPGGWFNAIAIGEPVTVDGGDLDAALVIHLTELFTPVVAYALPHSRLGRRTVWAMVADRLVQALFPEDPADPGARAARELLESMLAGRGPLEQRRRWTSVRLAGDREALSPVSAACCLAYKTDGEFCARVCPKSSEDARAAEIRQLCGD
ncbi:ferric iron reductase [Phytomonospora sp. NPDC050363]|uniref:ferric iron reductase n=1 Tax=Phytomonospora sp. NPDC050363 TaxID=3155642 RepID=UPI0033C7F918